MFELLRDWVRGFWRIIATNRRREFLDEAAWLLLRDAPLGTRAGRVRGASAKSTGLRRQPSRRSKAAGCGSRYVGFMQKLRAHETLVVPVFARFQQSKKDLIAEARARLGLDDFKPKVLTSFVRNG